MFFIKYYRRITQTQRRDRQLCKEMINLAAVKTDSSILFQVIVFAAIFICGHGERTGHSEPVRVAVVINNDHSALHLQNAKQAKEALERLSCVDEIVVLGESNKAPYLHEILQTLDEIQTQGKELKVLYLTGHGTRIYNQEDPEGNPSLMLRDHPLTVAALAPRVGPGPCLIYIDICFAPLFITRLKEQLKGEFLILTDKNFDRLQTSCRGFSAEFWQRLIETYRDGMLFEASIAAWKQTCPQGQKIKISLPANPNGH